MKSHFLATVRERSVCPPIVLLFAGWNHILFILVLPVVSLWILESGENSVFGGQKRSRWGVESKTKDSERVFTFSVYFDKVASAICVNVFVCWSAKKATVHVFSAKQNPGSACPISFSYWEKGEGGKLSQGGSWNAFIYVIVTIFPNVVFLKTFKSKLSCKSCFGISWRALLTSVLHYIWEHWGREVGKQELACSAVSCCRWEYWNGVSCCSGVGVGWCLPQILKHNHQCPNLTLS